MIDLGQTFYEERRYFFNRLTVYQIVMNPRLQGYPPAFMICKELNGTKPCEYAVGVTFLQLNQILMKRVNNSDRLTIAERLADAIVKQHKTETIRVHELLGRPLTLSGLDATTQLRRFESDPSQCGQPLYYFQLTEGVS